MKPLTNSAVDVAPSVPLGLLSFQGNIFNPVCFSTRRLRQLFGFRDSLLHHRVSCCCRLSLLKSSFFILFGDFPNSRTAEKHCGLHPASICALEGKSEKKTPPADVAGGVHSAARGQMNIRHASPYLLARTYFSISLNSPLV